jgi:hypothetical protein
MNTRSLKGITHCQRIHNRCQQSHMVNGDAIQSRGVERCATKNITTTDNETDLHANAYKLAYFQRHLIKNLWIYTNTFDP